MSRFSKKEQKQLVGLTDLINETDALSERAEALRWIELTSDPYELETWAAYCSQVSALGKHFRLFLDAKLERSPDADRIEREAASGWELMGALQEELRGIVDQHFERVYGVLFQDQQEEEQ